MAKSILIRGKKPARKASAERQKAARAPVRTLDKAPKAKKASGQKIKTIPGRTAAAIEVPVPVETVARLTAKQFLFVSEYFVDLNATQAATRAGYSAQTARQTGSENLSKPYIAAEIERALAERGGITQTRLIEELAKIAFSDIRKVVRWVPGPAGIRAPKNGAATERIENRVTLLDSDEIDDDVRGAVAEVSQGANGALHVKMHDKVAALDKLARLLGMYRIKVDVSHTRPPRVVFEYYGAPDEVLARNASSHDSGGNEDGDD